MSDRVRIGSAHTLPALVAVADAHRLDIADRRHTDARTTRQKLLPRADITGHSPVRLRIAEVRREEFEEAPVGRASGK